jgi:hypothetical protein
MADLNSIMSGVAGYNPSQSNSAPAPNVPQPQAPIPSANQQDSGFQQRKQGWLSALQEMASDPENAAMLLQFGTSLASSQGNPASRISGAMAEAAAMKGRMSKGREDKEAKRRAEEREQSSLDNATRGRDMEAQRLQWEKEKFQAQQKWQQEELKFQRERLRQAKAGGSGGPGADNVALRQEAANRRYAAAIRTQSPWMSEEDAMTEVEYRSRTQSRDEWVNARVEMARKAHGDVLKNPYGDGASIGPFDVNAAITDAQKEYDAQLKARYQRQEAAPEGATPGAATTGYTPESIAQFKSAWSQMSAEAQQKVLQRATTDSKIADMLQAAGISIDGTSATGGF